MRTASGPSATIPNVVDRHGAGTTWGLSEGPSFDIAMAAGLCQHPASSDDSGTVGHAALNGLYETRHVAAKIPNSGEAALNRGLGQFCHPNAIFDLAHRCEPSEVHGRKSEVDMAVDQSWHHKLAASVDRLIGFAVVILHDIDDDVVLDHHVAFDR